MNSITLKPEIKELYTLNDFILNELHSGATIYDSYGVYDGKLRREIVTIVDKNEYRKLTEFIKKTDPTAFVTVIAVNDMQYQIKKKKKD